MPSRVELRERSPRAPYVKHFLPGLHVRKASDEHPTKKGVIGADGVGSFRFSSRHWGSFQQLVVKLTYRLNGIEYQRMYSKKNQNLKLLNLLV